MVGQIIQSPVRDERISPNICGLIPNPFVTIREIRVKGSDPCL